MKNRLLLIAIGLSISISAACQNQHFTTDEKGWHYNECILASMIKKLYGEAIMLKMVTENDYKFCRIIVYYSSYNEIDSIYISDMFYRLTNDILYKEHIINELRNQEHLYTLVSSNLSEVSLFPSGVILDPCKSLMKYDYEPHYRGVLDPLKYIDLMISYYKQVNIKLMQDELLETLATIVEENDDDLKRKELIYSFVCRNMGYFKSIGYYDMLMSYYD